MIFKNAVIVDGTGNKPYLSDVQVKKDFISKIEKNISFENDEEKIIDCSNKILCPGFIDIHAHSDIEALRNPSMLCKRNQGITSDISGNCGIGTFPYIKGQNGVFQNILGSYNKKWNWNDYNSYISNLNPDINMGFLQNHSLLRIMAIDGNPNREAKFAEIEKMKQLLDDSLKNGALGFSTGLYYAPCFFASREELKQLLFTTKKYDGIFAVHHRCEGSDIIASIKEILDLALETGVRTEISHLKVIGLKNQYLLDQVLESIEKANSQGAQIAFDQYPYEYGSTSLKSLLPPQYLTLSSKELTKILKDKDERKNIKKIMENPQGWDSLAFLCGWDNIFTENNITFTEMAKKQHQDSFDCFFDILYKDQENAIMRDITQSEDSICKIMQHDLSVFGTDALYTDNCCHPRSYNCSVHYLTHYIKEKKLMSIEKAIYRMTGKTAERLRLKKRGVIKPGYKADLVLLDWNQLEDLSSPSNPCQKPKGFNYVMVNGENNTGTILKRN